MLNSEEAPLDTDKDGMPDEWEDANSLDKNDASDGAIVSANGYTNVENYLNSLVENHQFIVRPLHFKSDSVSENLVYLSWTDISDNEDAYAVERRSEGEAWSVISTEAADAENYTDESITESGVYFFRLKATGNEAESFYTDSIYVEVNLAQQPSGAKAGYNTDFNCSIFPNPVQSDLNISIGLNRESVMSVQVLDIKGSVINSLLNETRQAGKHTLTFDTSLLEKGVYLVRVQTNSQQTVLKFIK